MGVGMGPPGERLGVTQRDGSPFVPMLSLAVRVGVDQMGKKSVVGGVIRGNPLIGNSPSTVSPLNTHKQLFSQSSYLDFVEEEDSMVVIS